MSRFAWANRLIGVTAAVALALAACTSDEPSASPEGDDVADAETDADTEPTEPGATAAEDEGGPEPRNCAGEGPAEAISDLTGDDPVAVATAVAAVTHRCADTVVVADPDHAWAATLAAPVAAAAGAPLLLASVGGLDALGETITALEPPAVVTLGLREDVSGLVGSDVEVTALGADDATDTDTEDTTEDATDDDTAADDAPETGGDDAAPDPALTSAVIDHLGEERALGFAAGDAGSRAAALSRAGEGLPLLPLPEDAAELEATVTQLPPSLRVETIARDGEAAQALADRLVDLGVDAEPSASPRFATDPSEVAWLADPVDRASYAVAAASAGARDEVLLPVHGDAPWREAGRTERVREVGPERVALVGDADAAAADWQLRTVLSNEPLPSGGYTLFDTERMVALYGTPGSRALGALGEQDLDATIARLREVAEPYGADGRTVLPAFEIITTVASAEAGDRGDYSRRLDPEGLQPWIDRAAEEGIYVILDLQPGRTDFLDQAQEYRDLLAQPHVGLALDPEWRLEDDEVHLRQIGSVAAEEVQRVADWLAEVVREEQLPQKLLILHQFRHDMLPDRDTVEVGPELAAVVHMDGQGPIGTKYDTYAAITAGAEDRWWWGWKNFYDEDSPTPTPEQVLALDPLPVFVSYQ
ncbi:hypothetical protein [Egicoccus sp. AB-alg6-2]|uniref:hypothetical protein n=1 Tax=Egicoccus sp. AB-alg6-2 TaxID=3242692 RepID=UPI00359D20AE